MNLVSFFFFLANARYLVLFVLTLLALIFWPTSGTSLWNQCRNMVTYSRQVIASNLFGGETKAKDEDADYEYEMMWDAEGSMHLVKKPLNASSVNLSEQSVGERCSLDLDILYYFCYYC